ncbi:putative late blight resistance protein homolog R1B-8 [Olea europaea var. sylvestris]|uniref:putative late blight resistance protein homolog R1B-8 n=1 Tax=Olea europaea var. sylvestris TaxID=158386 RepID=UPI000C1CF099|nr:putative late blight resistance protein homolog R1B-8 [Olea europaea var. sylvestris]
MDLKSGQNTASSQIGHNYTSFTKILTKEMLEASNEQLSESMYKNLKGRRYVIVLDDVRDTKVLDDLKRLFPNDKDESRIMLTTRLEKVANHGNSSRPYHMRFLNWDESWNLFCRKGLLKPVKSRSLEDVAEGYLLDLVDRNLVLVHQQSSKGKIKTCKIHDLLRDLCMREAEREKFFHVMKKDLLGISEGIALQRLRIHYQGEHHYTANCLPNLLVRSLFNFGKWENFRELDLNVRLLKVWEMESSTMTKSSIVIVEMVNLRYLASTCKDMPQLRHVQLNHVVLPDPPTIEAKEENCFIVLEHLQTLSMVYDFKLTLEILKRIPNLKKLRIHYEQRRWNWGDYCQSNLVSLHNLESLKCTFSGMSRSSLKNVTFPTSLQKLTVTGGKFPWKDMKIIGSLPNLLVLKLKSNAFHGRDWEPNEGEFLQLKFLLLGRHLSGALES